jgi:hypothetical protein
MSQWKVIKVTDAHVAVVRQIDPMERNRDVEVDGDRPKRIT